MGRVSRLMKGYQTIAVLFLNTLILLICFEVFASITLNILDKQNEEEHIQKLATLGYYENQTWAQAYWQDHVQQGVDYRSFVAWHSKPYVGETITIDHQGYRATPGGICTDEAYTVFAFGGSTMWGFGSPDWATLPAYLQNELAAHNNDPVCVRNFGQQGHFSTQEVIELMLQLQQGQIPDVVIFYDGINDVWTAEQNGRSNAHLSEKRINELLTQKVTFLSWLKTTNTVKLLTRLSNKIDLLSLPEDANETSIDRPETSDLVEVVLQTYLTNYQIVASLGEAYHFDYYFFWQPMSYSGKNHLTYTELGTPVYSSQSIEFINEVHNEIDKLVDDVPCFTSLTKIINANEELIWIDWMHLTPTGNEIIAKEMVHVLQTSPCLDKR